MQRLQQHSDLYICYVKKLDQQETECLKNTEEKHRLELQNYVLNLDVA